MAEQPSSVPPPTVPACIVGSVGVIVAQGPVSQPAYLAGMYAFTGVMAALWARADGRSGQYVDVSELEAVAASHQWTVSRYNYSSKVQQRIGNRYDSGHPITIYPAADGY